MTESRRICIQISLLCRIHPTMAEAHLVGSMNLDTADDVFRTVAEHGGPSVRRIPDGETGPRARAGSSTRSRALDREPVASSPPRRCRTATSTSPAFRLRDGVAPEDVVLRPRLRDDRRRVVSGVQAPEGRGRRSAPTSSSRSRSRPRSAISATSSRSRTSRGRRRSSNGSSRPRSRRSPRRSRTTSWRSSGTSRWSRGRRGRHRLGLRRGGPARPGRGDGGDGARGRHARLPPLLRRRAARPEGAGRALRQPKDTGDLADGVARILERVGGPSRSSHMPVPIDRDDDV